MINCQKIIKEEDTTYYIDQGKDYNLYTKYKLLDRYVINYDHAIFHPKNVQEILDMSVLLGYDIDISDSKKDKALRYYTINQLYKHIDWI